jgi:hypothetical protein
MAIEFHRVAPLEVRDAVVDLFWRLGSWPWPDKADCYRYWDWRYTSLSEVTPVVWVATDGGKIVGHMALYPRRFKLGDAKLRVGVPGNFLVDPEYRNSPIGPRLAASTRTPLRTGELDAIFGYGNKLAHSMLVRLGFREIGAMELYADVQRWGSALNRRVPGAAVFAGIASAAQSLRKVVRRAHPPRDVRDIEAVFLSPEETANIDRSAWRTNPEALVADYSSQYLADRYLRSPFRPRKLIALVDQGSRAVEGYVVVEGDRRVKVVDCQVNEERMGEPEAVAMAVKAIPTAETLVVPLLPQSDLAAAFLAAGFVHRRINDFVEGNTWWSAQWSASSPAANALEKVNRWKLWFGWNHH